MPTDLPTVAQQNYMDWLRRQEPRVVADLKCPDCGAAMQLRVGRFGRFYGCSQYQETGCKGSVTAREDGTPAGIPGTARVRALRHQIMQLMDNRRTGPHFGWPVEDPKWPKNGVGKWDEDDCHTALELMGVQPVVPPIPPDTVWERLDRDMFDD